MKAADKLKQIPFPDCAKHCKAMECFGVCECENICPFKFDKDGNSLTIEQMETKPEGEI